MQETQAPNPPTSAGDNSSGATSDRVRDAGKDGAEAARGAPAHGTAVVRHRGRAATSPYGLSRLAPAMSLVDVAAEIEKADELVGTVVSSKLQVIAAQIRALQAEAERVLEKARGDLELHRARCSFSRRVGHTYHLYRRDDGELYWSMLSPEDWGGRSPHEYEGSFRLEPDQSWTPIEEIPDLESDPTRFDPEQVVAKLLPG